MVTILPQVIKKICKLRPIQSGSGLSKSADQLDGNITTKDYRQLMQSGSVEPWVTLRFRVILPSLQHPSVPLDIQPQLHLPGLKWKCFNNNCF